MASLPDELLLMALGEKASGYLCHALHYGLPGAILSELFQQRRLTLTTDGLVAASGSAKSAGDAVLDDALSRIRSAPSLRAVRHWLGQEFRRRGKTREALLERLLRAGFVVKTETRLLGLFHRDRYTLADATATAALKTALRKAIISGAIEPRDAALIALAHVSGVRFFEKRERKGFLPRMESLVAADPVASAAAAAVREEQAVVAMMAATTAATS
jgi:hypothetical protein